MLIQMDATPPQSPALDPRLWVERYGDYLYRFALARVRTPDAAEDLVQETLLAAWQGRASFAGQASEKSWLTAIVKRKVVDWLRRRVRERAFHEEAEEAAFDPFDKSGHWTKSPRNWRESSAHQERDEFWATLQACLGKLPPRLQDAFVLRYLEEEPSEKVCKELGLSATNFWVILHRARLRMSQCLSLNWFGNAQAEGRSC